MYTEWRITTMDSNPKSVFLNLEIQDWGNL